MRATGLVPRSESPAFPTEQEEIKWLYFVTDGPLAASRTLFYLFTWWMGNSAWQRFTMSLSSCCLHFALICILHRSYKHGLSANSSCQISTFPPPPVLSFTDSASLPPPPRILHAATSVRFSSSHLVHHCDTKHCTTS